MRENRLKWVVSSGLDLHTLHLTFAAFNESYFILKTSQQIKYEIINY